MTNITNHTKRQAEKGNNGIAEKPITGDDMKRFKNALDNTRTYISGDEERSSSSHQFSDKTTK